jgi:hypothetical protein
VSPRLRAERTLNLAVAWFLAVPVFVLGYASIAWQVIHADTPPPFFVPAVAALLTAAFGAALLWLVVRLRPRVGAALAGILGLVLVTAAIGAVALVGHADVALVAFVWPGFPGIALIDGAWRLGRVAGSPLHEPVRPSI